MTTEDTERKQFKLRHGTTTAIDAALKPGETREDFIREAVEDELQKRERRRLAGVSLRDPR